MYVEIRMYILANFIPDTVVVSTQGLWIINLILLNLDKYHYVRVDNFVLHTTFQQSLVQVDGCLLTKAFGGSVIPSFVDVYLMVTVHVCGVLITTNCHKV